MNRILLQRGVALLGLGVILAGVFAPSATSGSTGQYLAAVAATPVFLQQPSAAGWTSSGPGGNRNHLPNSTLIAGGVATKCSVDTSDPLGARCSTAAISGGNCSARCDMDQQCSAFFVPNGTSTAASCSVFALSGGLCSVLQPANAQIAPSFCSVDGGPPAVSLQCSVMAPGNRQVCSAENPARLRGNDCSTRNTNTAVPGHDLCSVLGGGSRPNYCSVGGSTTGAITIKHCSTFSPNSECSIRAGNRGACTNFQGTPSGSCSAFGMPSHCSVIGGLPGNLCVQ